MPRRKPTGLAFKGWWVDGPEIRVQCRVMVETSSGAWAEHGPNLWAIIPADCLLDEDIINAAHWAQQRQERRERFQALIDAEMDQDPLF